MGKGNIVDRGPPLPGAVKQPGKLSDAGHQTSSNGSKSKPRSSMHEHVMYLLSGALCCPGWTCRGTCPIRMSTLLRFRCQDNDTFAKRLRILAEASLDHGLSPTLRSTLAPEPDAHAQRPAQHAEPSRRLDPPRLQPHLQGREQSQAFPAPRPAHSAPVERRGSGSGLAAVVVPGSVSEGSPNLEGFSGGTASGTAPVAPKGSRGVGGAPTVQLNRPGGAALADASVNRDGSPESKWATVDPLGSPHGDISGSVSAPLEWQVAGAKDGLGSGTLGRGVRLPPHLLELAQTHSQELQTAQSMSVDLGTPRAHAASVPPVDPFQQRLQTPEQREHAHRGRPEGGASGAQGGMSAPLSQVRLLGPSQ